MGSHGYSLRMDGLEPGINDQGPGGTGDRDPPRHYVNPLWSKTQAASAAASAARRSARKWRVRS